MAWELLPVNYTDATWSGLKNTPKSKTVTGLSHFKM